MSTLALEPVSEAVYGVLVTDATLTTLVDGRIYDDVPQVATFPFVWFETREREFRGLGAGTFPEVDLRVHVFSVYPGAREAQRIIDRCLVLLKDTALTVTGFTQAGKVFYDETVLLPDENVNGTKCRELVALFRVYAEA